MVNILDAVVDVSRGLRVDVVEGDTFRCSSAEWSRLLRVCEMWTSSDLNGTVANDPRVKGRPGRNRL